MFLVYNSDIVTEEQFQVPASDRAFQYGDGLFETIRYENGTLWFWNDHLDRLRNGLSALHLTPPVDLGPETLRGHVEQLLAANDLTSQSARIKIQVWRQAGGLYTPDRTDSNYLITCRKTTPFGITKKTKIAIYDAFHLTHTPVSCYKTLNALPYVLAGLYRQANGADDVVLLSHEGYLAECVASNLFWFRGETLCTPSLQTGCIAGIARRQLLRLADSVQEGLFTPDALIDADVVFAANVMGVQLFRGTLPTGWPDLIRSQFTDPS